MTFSSCASFDTQLLPAQPMFRRSLRRGDRNGARLAWLPSAHFSDRFAWRAGDIRTVYEDLHVDRPNPRS